MVDRLDFRGNPLEDHVFRRRFHLVCLAGSEFRRGTDGIVPSTSLRRQNTGSQDDGRVSVRESRSARLVDCLSSDESANLRGSRLVDREATDLLWTLVMKAGSPGLGSGNLPWVANRRERPRRTYEQETLGGSWIDAALSHRCKGMTICRRVRPFSQIEGGKPAPVRRVARMPWIVGIETAAPDGAGRYCGELSKCLKMLHDQGPAGSVDSSGWMVQICVTTEGPEEALSAARSLIANAASRAGLPYWPETGYLLWIPSGGAYAEVVDRRQPGSALGPHGIPLI